jgi:tyrosyl-tRNA synthetase
MFAGAPIVDPDVLRSLFESTGGFTFAPTDGTGVASFMAEAGLTASKGEARRLIQGGGVTINGERIADPEAPVPSPIAGEWLEVRIGKRRREIGRCTRS